MPNMPTKPTVHKKEAPEAKNYAFCQATIKIKGDIELNFMGLAERLYRIRALNMFQPTWGSFEEFCLELKNMSYPSVMKLIDIHEKFVLTYKFSPARIAEAGGWSKIAECLPAIKTKEDAEKWLEKSTELTREDLRKELKEHSTGIDMRDCAHDDTYTVRICRTCGNKETLHDRKN